MSFDLVVVLVLLAVALGLFVTERLAVEIVALLILATLLVLGILDPAEGLSGFSNEATVTVAAMFVLSGGLYRSGVLDFAGRGFEVLAGRSMAIGVGAMMVFAGAGSAFINNTAVVAVAMPIVLDASRRLKVSPSKLLIPLSFAAMLGGVCTLIGTSTNLLVSAIAVDHGMEPFGMFEFSTMGFVFFALGIAYMFFVGIPSIPERRPPGDLAGTYRIGEYLAEIVLGPASTSVGKTVGEAPMARDLDVVIVHMRRPDGDEIVPTAETVLREGDVLLVRCDMEHLDRLRRREGVVLAPKDKWKDEELEPGEAMLVEAVVAPGSWLEGETLSSMGFRNRFRSTVIGIRHRGELIRERLKEVRLEAGDALLVETTGSRLPQMQESGGFVIVSEVPGVEFRPSKAVPAIVILAAVVATAALGLAPIVVSATAGAVAMVVLGCLTPEEAHRAIDWPVIFLLAGVLSLGLAMERTGGARFLSEGLILGVGGMGPVILIATVYLVTTVLTAAMSNNATAVLIAPIAIATAESIGADPRPFLVAVTFAASASFLTPVGYQTNTMIYGPGGYRFADYFRVGAPLNLLLWILASLLIPYFWPL